GKAGSHCLEEGCYGFSAAVTKIVGDTHTRIADNLLSLGGRDGSFSVGVDAVSEVGGHVFAIQTSAGPLPEVKGSPLSLSGDLVEVGTRPRPVRIAAVDEFEFANDPDGQGVDSDPYGLVALSPTHQVVADAAGNDLLDVNDGHVSLITVFPDVAPGV